MAIEKKGRGTCRAYAKQIETSSAKDFKPFFEANIAKQAHIKTDGWRGYSPLKEEFTNLTQEKSGKKGENFKPMHRWIIGFKSWLRGIHNHAKDLEYYLNEYGYRFNRCVMDGAIFDNLITRTVNAKPAPSKLPLVSKCLIRWDFINSDERIPLRTFYQPIVLNLSGINLAFTTSQLKQI